MVIAVLVQLWAGITLMTQCRVEEYLSTPHARRLYAVAAAAPLVIAAAIVTLAFCTTIWWVELAACLFAALIVFTVSWKVWMRLSGRYVEFYKPRQWR